MQEFPWIATEKDFFGKPGSDYDFEAQDVQATFEEYEAANQSLQRLANKVNRKVPLTPTLHACSDQQDTCMGPIAGMHAISVALRFGPPGGHRLQQWKMHSPACLHQRRTWLAAVA